MNLSQVAALLRRHRMVVALAALLLLFAGVDLLLNPPEGQDLGVVGIPFLAAGLGLFAVLLRQGEGVAPAEARRTLASRFLDRVTLRGRLVRYAPLVAIAVIAVDLAYNEFVFRAISLATEDTIVLLFAAALFAYPFVPARFGRERDFVLMFTVSLVLILVLPLLLARLAAGNLEQSVDSYSWAALAPQTAWVLNLLGVQAWVHPFVDPVSGALLGTAPAMTFATKAGPYITVVITTACSGIYSFGIFASAFVAFVLTEYERFDPRVLLLLVLGFVTSYVANVLRMVLIVLFGAYSVIGDNSVESLLVAHSNLGWIIFLGWVSLFWFIVFRFVVRQPAPRPRRAPRRWLVLRQRPAPRKRGVLCGVCGDALTPALPGYRCECGRFYHVACAATVEECLKCHRPIRTWSGPDSHSRA